MIRKAFAPIRKEPLLFGGAVLSLVAGIIELVATDGVTLASLWPLASGFAGRWFVWSPFSHEREVAKGDAGEVNWLVLACIAVIAVCIILVIAWTDIEITGP
jgi:hypothetical protein